MVRLLCLFLVASQILLGPLYAYGQSMSQAEFDRRLKQEADNFQLLSDGDKAKRIAQLEKQVALAREQVDKAIEEHQAVVADGNTKNTEIKLTGTAAAGLAAFSGLRWSRYFKGQKQIEAGDVSTSLKGQMSSDLFEGMMSGILCLVAAFAWFTYINSVSVTDVQARDYQQQLLYTQGLLEKDRAFYQIEATEDPH